MQRIPRKSCEGSETSCTRSFLFQKIYRPYSKIPKLYQELLTRPPQAISSTGFYLGILKAHLSVDAFEVLTVHFFLQHEGKVELGRIF